MVWGRAGWTGSQRYPIQWGGDPQSDWEGLAASIRGGLSWGMSGDPYHSSDIGGFYGAQQPSPELYVRWLQAAVFSSHIRVHGIGEREPWAFGAEAEAIARKWLAFRYRLIPYLQRVIADARRTRAAGDARDAARVPGQRAAAPLRDAVHVRRHAARRADRRAGRRGRDRAAAGRLVRPQFAPAPRRRQRRPLPRGARPVPGVRARRLRAAARPRRPAHRRDRPARAARAAVGVRRPTRPLDGLRAGADRRRRGRRVRGPRRADVTVERFGDAPRA